jgi:alkylation response protein AidB-like acyl-CoA dehydrogenase
MVFSLTKEKMDIQRAARAFAEGEFRAVARESDAGETFEDRLWRKAAQPGFLAIFIPDEYGGAGLSFWFSIRCWMFDVRSSPV